MKTSAKKTILKNAAKNVMAGKYFASITAFLFYGMMVLCLNRFSINLNRVFCLSLMNALNLNAESLLILCLSYVIPFLFSVITNVFQLGFCLFFLNFATGKTAYVSDLLYGFFHHLGKSLKLSLATTLVSFFCMLPSEPILEMLLGTAKLSVSRVLLLVLAQLVFLLILLPLGLALSQVFYLALDYPDLTAGEILRLSLKVMKGKKRQLFIIQLSFLPLYLLGVLSFGIGLFWIVPYQKMTLTLYYLDLMKPSDPEIA